jgi:transposase
MKRHALTDEQWAMVEPLIPRPKKRKSGRGRPPKDPRLMLDGILWILATGAPWRDLPDRFGRWRTVYGYFSQWRRGGVFSAIIQRLQIKLDNKGLIDWELWCVDGACVRASRAAAGAEKKVSCSTPTNQPTTRWAAAEVGLERSSMWSLTARELPWRSTSRPDRSAKRPSQSR